MICGRLTECEHICRNLLKHYIGCALVDFHNDVTVYINDVINVTTPHTCDFSDATCTEDSACTICGAAGADKATGHTDVADSNGICDVCGQNVNVVIETATISFADKANRTEYSTSLQVWEQNGIKVTNNKAASSSNVGDYANPARFYKGSEVIIEKAGMTKIVIDCSGLETKYNVWVASIGTISGATVTAVDSTVVIEFDAPVDSFTIAKTSAQARAASITVTYQA